jgi:hypothetical protein
LLAQEGHRLRPFSASRERLGVDLDGGAQRRGDPAIAVQPASAQQFESQFAGPADYDSAWSSRLASSVKWPAFRKGLIKSFCALGRSFSRLLTRASCRPALGWTILE